MHHDSTLRQSFWISLPQCLCRRLPAGGRSCPPAAGQLITSPKCFGVPGRSGSRRRIFVRRLAYSKGRETCVKAISRATNNVHCTTLLGQLSGDEPHPSSIVRRKEEVSGILSQQPKEIYRRSGSAGLSTVESMTVHIDDGCGCCLSGWARLASADPLLLLSSRIKSFRRLNRPTIF